MFRLRPLLGCFLTVTFFVCALPAVASASMFISTDDRPPGQPIPVPGAAGTLILRSSGTHTVLTVRHDPITHVYTFAVLTGTIQNDSPAPIFQDALIGLCSGQAGAGTATVSCPEAAPGEPPIHVRVESDAFGMNVNLFDASSVGGDFTALAYPSSSFEIELDDGANTVVNATGSSVVFKGGIGTDIYKPGVGTDVVSGGSGLSDKVEYLSNVYTTERCVNVTLDDAANDTAGPCSSAGNLTTVQETDNIKSDVENVTGGAGADSITGTAAVNALLGEAGNDLLAGAANNDTLDSGTGGATMDGGTGADVFVAPTGGGATVTYAARAAAVSASSDGVANDGEGAGAEGDNIDVDVNNLIGGSSGDTLTLAGLATGMAPVGDIFGGNVGQSGSTISGGSGGDQITGSPFNDRLNGEDGIDTIQGGNGHDHIEPGGAKDIFNGGADLDTLDYSAATSGMSLSMDATSNDGDTGDEFIGSNIENINGSQGADTITGDGTDNFLQGRGGDDLVNGNAGNDIITPDPLPADGGCDTVLGGTGDDFFQHDLTQTTCNDLLDYSDHAAAVDVDLDVGSTLANGSGAEADLIAGGRAWDVKGTTLDDSVDVTIPDGLRTLSGLAGVDTFSGAAGDETFIGGLGNDVFSGGGGSDTASYLDRSTPVVADLAEPSNDGEISLAENDSLTGIENLTGGAAADNLTGDGGANVLTGGIGSDQLLGGGGLDTASYADHGVPVTADLDGLDDDGAPSLSESDHFDSIENLTGGTVADTLTGNDFVNVLRGGAGADVISGLGGAGDDIGGDAGDDQLIPGSGGSVVRGDAGNDTIPARNSVADTIFCGDGTDPVVADTNDAVAADCEQVDRPVVAVADVTAPVVSVSPRALKLSAKRKVRVRVTCPLTEVRCEGKLTLKSAVKVKLARASRKAVVTIGSVRFILRGGESQALTIKVTRKPFATLRTLGKLKVKASVVAIDAASNRATTTSTHTLKFTRG